MLALDRSRSLTHHPEPGWIARWRWRVALLAALVLLGGQGAWPQGGTTTRVSVDSGGGECNGSSDWPSISGDGRFVAFESAASDLVDGDDNRARDIFVHDRLGGQTRRMSVSSQGQEGDGPSTYPRISPDGRYVAFESGASNLVAGDTNGKKDVFLHDRWSGETTRVSVDSSGIQGNGLSGAPGSPSLDGCVPFRSFASNLVTGDTNGVPDIFVHEPGSGQTTRVSVDSAGNQGNKECFTCSITPDGRFVALQSKAGNLVAGDTNETCDIFVHERSTGQIARVSVSSAGQQGNARSTYPGISSDGRYVAFDSAATNLVGGDTNAQHDIFVHDRLNGQTRRVSVDSTGIQGNAESWWCSLSSDGQTVAFQSKASNLVLGDTNEVYDVFVHHRPTGQTTRVSVDSTGEQGDDSSRHCTISSSGELVAFDSRASALVAGDANGEQDAFVRDRRDCASSAATYCTAKTTSTGCTPSVSHSGVPSATASAGFEVTAIQVEPERPGVLFYGVSGPAAFPFQGGLLCVAPPIRRTPPQSSGSSGSPPCAGALSLDLNAAGICAWIGAGHRGWMQGWFRDPASPEGTGLTDAIEWTVCP